MFCLATDNNNPYSICNTASADAIFLYSISLSISLSLSTCTDQRPVRYSEPVAHAHCVLRDSAAAAVVIACVYAIVCSSWSTVLMAFDRVSLEVARHDEND